MPDYEKLGAEVGALVTKKQAAYGDSFGKSGDVLRILYPDGVSTDQLDDALVVTRIVDKLFRIATDRDALGESPWADIAGYALLATERRLPSTPPVDGEGPYVPGYTFRKCACRRYWVYSEYLIHGVTHSVTACSGGSVTP